MTTFPLADRRAAFRAAAVAFVPELARAPDPVWDRLEATIGQALAARPARMVRQLRLFVAGLDWLSRLRHGRGLAGLDLERRVAFLQRFERSPALLVRRGVWGLRTLVFMGYYTQAEVMTTVGYRASPEGWAARR
ncbi:MAG: hypothetical protein IT352_04315 [Gemmatimonadales bacterium]|nr:hypothetical protein [Gemmatimonadales bacterium]